MKFGFGKKMNKRRKGIRNPALHQENFRAMIFGTYIVVTSVDLGFDLDSTGGLECGLLVNSFFCKKNTYNLHVNLHQIYSV